MLKKISQIAFVMFTVLLLVSCKNTKQKLQEYVTTYNSTAPSFRAENVRLTTARGYINDDKIELRFETSLEQNETNKSAAAVSFPKLIKEMIDKDEIPRQLIEEGVRFDVYFLAGDDTVLDKEVLDGESLKDFLK